MERLRREYAERIGEDLRGIDRIKSLQKFFQKSDGKPIFLKGKHDLILYRGSMGLSLVGLAFCFGAIFMMDTNKLKKKQR